MQGRGTDYYSSPDEVCKIAKIDKVDFACSTDTDLGNFLITILKDAKSVIDNYTKRTFSEVPESIHGVARDYCLNVLANARTISQYNGDLSNYSSYPNQSAVFTNDLKERLNYIIGTSWSDSSTVKVRVFNASAQEKKDEEN